MVDVVQVASYVCDRYLREYGYRIDELKLHKLLYFIQRECLIQRDQPMFAESFCAWRYGPVIPKIRVLYAIDQLKKKMPLETIQEYLPVLDYVFAHYAGKQSMSLSDISHSQLSWIHAREGVEWDRNSKNCLLLDDIRKDAIRAKNRRALADALNMTE